MNQIIEKLIKELDIITWKFEEAEWPVSKQDGRLFSQWKSHSEERTFI